MLIGAVFWILALALFVAPFLKTQAAPGWDDPDYGRKTEPYPEEEESGDYVLDLPFEQDVADFDAFAKEEGLGLESTLADWIRQHSEERYSIESMWESDLIEAWRLEAGEKTYFRYCAGCHGLDGSGAGPAATHMAPRPRNFRHGLFKFKSTPSGSRPLREDLMQVIERGIAGASMPHFKLLSLETRKDVVEWVRYLSIKGEFERMMLDLAWEDEELPDPDEVQEIVESRWSDLKAQFPSIPEPPVTPEGIERGRVLFSEASGASCYTCHGTGGQGDGPSADAYKDGWGYPVRPRDLTTGVYRAGGLPKDLYLTIANGIGGSPMPSYSDALTGEQIWDLVHFVMSLADQGGDR